MTKMAVRIYTCQKHPNWSLESTAPVMTGSLNQFCPLCRDDFFKREIGIADCRIEYRERPKPEQPPAFKGLL